jgi:hypothetical protein
VLGGGATVLCSLRQGIRAVEAPEARAASPMDADVAVSVCRRERGIYKKWSIH